MANGKILVVDDEARMRKLIRDFLTKAGYTVAEAADGQEAVEAFQKEGDVACIIMDVMMPRMDGYQATREIRRTSQVPIIMLTAKSEEQDELQGFELGVDEYVTKPFSPKALVARVDAILRRTSGEQQGKGEPDRLEIAGIVMDKKGHTVTIDGKPLELFRADWTLRAALLPAGEHDVEMYFLPASYRTGAAVSRITSILLLLVLAGAIVLLVAKKH